MKVRLEIKFEDLWVGAFWRRFAGKVDLWICLLPCVPIHISWPVKAAPHPKEPGCSAYREDHCIVHGDCECSDEALRGRANIDPGCPLHGASTVHPRQKLMQRRFPRTNP